jgi:acyl-homoserine lactone acylase PvdQ
MNAAYDSYLPWFEKTIPALLKAWDDTASNDPLKAQLADRIELLRGWDFRWGVESAATSLAVFWGEDLRRHAGGAGLQPALAANVPAEQLLRSLATASDKLAADFGSWKTPWGQINRFQRLTGDIVQPFSDAGASIPVGFTSSFWGSLASFGARAYPGTKKWYGTSGNSFVAVVEFGDRVRARAVTAGGESGHADSKHFDDEAVRYSAGDLRAVYFYKDELQDHTERQYHPGI